jgi:glycosyltransferase involved in cell wall biosynthesis
MNVLYLAGSAFPIRQARGIQIAHTVAGLARLGHQITLVAGGVGSPDEDAALRFYGLEPSRGVRMVQVPAWHPPVPAGSSWTSLASRIWMGTYLASLSLALPLLVASESPDVMFARTLRAADRAQRSRASRHTPLVYELHFLDSMNAAADGAANDARTLAWQRLEQRVFLASAGVVTLTSPARDLVLERYGLAPDRTVVIPSGTAGSVPVHDGDRESNQLIYAGQLQDWKGVELLVDVAARLPDATLRLLGGLGHRGRLDRNRVALEQRATELGVSNRVTFAGSLPYSQVQEQLQRATVAAIPLRDTPTGRLFTSPLKAFDYMWSRTPIVASDLPSLRDILRHEENALLVPPHDATAFAAAVRRLFGDSELRRRLAETAFQDVQKLTWDARARHLAQFLGSALSPPTRDVLSDGLAVG